MKSPRSKNASPAGAMPIATEWWPIARPKPYPKNARKWSQKAVEKVAASIREFGWRQPIVVDAHDVIVIGHLRLAAAHFLKLAQVPVHVAGDLSAAQIKALRLADNRTHEEAVWDLDLLGPEMLDLKGLNFDLALTGFEMNETINSVFGKSNKNAGSTNVNTEFALQFKVVVDCTGEQHQSELLGRLKDEGLKCRALIS